MHVGETLTDLQYLGCQLHNNAFGGGAPLGTTGGASLPRLHSRYKEEGEKGEERVGNREERGKGGREGKDGEGKQA